MPNENNNRGLDEGPHWKAGIDNACTMDLPDISKHHHEHGTIENREMILTEIEKMLEMGMYDLPQECACLLDVNPDDLYHWDMSQQQYWLQTLTAARSAHRRQESLGEVQESSQGSSTHTSYGEMEVGAGARSNPLTGDQRGRYPRYKNH